MRGHYFLTSPTIPPSTKCFHCLAPEDLHKFFDCPHTEHVKARLKEYVRYAREMQQAEVTDGAANLDDLLDGAMGKRDSGHG